MNDADPPSLNGTYVTPQVKFWIHFSSNKQTNKQAAGRSDPVPAGAHNTSLSHALLTRTHTLSHTLRTVNCAPNERAARESSQTGDVFVPPARTVSHERGHRKKGKLLQRSPVRRFLQREEPGCPGGSWGWGGSYLLPLRLLITCMADR